MGKEGNLAGQITALECQKKNTERVSVYLDGRFAFGLPAIVAATLRPGQVLSDAEIEALREKGGVEEAYGWALDYLSYRPRSRAELTNYLKKRRVPQAQIDAVTERLEQAELLGDEAFARYWVENRERFRPRGPAALRAELRLKGVDNEIIERALADLDVSASAYEAAGRRARQLSQADRATFQRKLVEFLVRRGYGFDVASEAAQRHWAELSEAQ